MIDSRSISISGPGSADLTSNPARWICSPEMDDRDFHAIRTQLALDHAKWDPRIGDFETLARFAIVLPGSVWRQLGDLSEKLASEALEAETELIRGDPRAIARLGLPRPIAGLFQSVSRGKAEPTPSLARVVRFDFHPTTEGWKISEANADVPGGFAESSEFPRLVAAQLSGTAPPGHPGDALARAIVQSTAEESPRIALVSGPGYLEDLQVTSYLADRLRSHGADAITAHPGQISWRGSQGNREAYLQNIKIDAILRFYQGEWTASRPRQAGWQSYFVGGKTPTCNPGSALIVESKRFALTWPGLRSSMPTWRALLPDCVDPRVLLGKKADGWVLKRAFCNTGESIFWPGSPGKAAASWRSALWRARLRPTRWVAQRRFEAIPVETPVGPMYPCLGVYTIDGRASGIYGRLAREPRIDYRAMDVAVLIREDSSEGSG